MGVCNQRPDPAPLPPAEGPSTHFAEGWVVLEACLYGHEKIPCHRGSKPRTVQPITSHYTDGTIPAIPVTTLRGLI